MFSAGDRLIEGIRRRRLRGPLAGYGAPYHHEVAEWTIAQVSRMLGEPQHRLIYFCEKGAVVPDGKDAQGRGSSRVFSARNVLELALASRLRKLELPVAVIAGILLVLRSFTTTLQKADSSFDLTARLREPQGPDLKVLVKDGEKLYFSMEAPPAQARLFGGLDYRNFGGRRRLAVPRTLKELKVVSPQGRSLGGPEHSREARIEVSVTEVARSLRNS